MSLFDIQVAHHEAGHAVAAALTDWPFRYATIRPRTSGRRAGSHTAGHLVTRTRRRDRDWSRTPRWEAYGVVTAAGLAAETALTAARLSFQPVTEEDRRRLMAGVSGHGSLPGDGDLPTLRWIARAVHYTATPEYDPAMFGPYDLGPTFDPAWSTTPDGVAEIGAFLWTRAVDMVARAWPAVHAVADEMWRHERAVTERRVKEIIGECRGVAGLNPDAIGQDFWPARLGRLSWRPHGQTRRGPHGAAAAA